MAWEKLGLLITPNKKMWWAQSHAMLPTPENLTGDVYKIYFGSRNQQNQSHIGYVIIDITAPSIILEYSSDPILKPGRLGCFDDNGVLPSCVTSNGTEKLLYYIGFKPGGTTRMDLFGGVAISSDNGKTFERWSEAPIIGRSRVNPLINTAPWVIKSENGWLMYYVGGVEWITPDLPRYNIQIATSDDGLNWHREGKVAVNFKNQNETSLARPYVFHNGKEWEMWFSHKGKAYQPGHATSQDGINWTRNDAICAIGSSGIGHDSHMMEYMIVLKSSQGKVMFYNGNNYGYEGICVAIEA
ncbi:hypothetical protein [Kiloniella laminariae]|uniref:hypothetical protein n=1 Tax=Kiloniella laminariae TaxID=454162 RepID=UPI00035EDFB5|nr:hypothetical protein [Kiloniella laminariae]